MKYLKLYRYDLRQGLLARWGCWPVICAVSAFFFFCFCLEVFHFFYFEVDGFGGINAVGLSFGDVVLTQAGGELPPDPNLSVEDFVFPVKWLFLHALILYFTLGYTSEDLTRCGMQVMTRTGSKLRWWLSKCLWNCTAVVSYYALFMAVLLALTALTGKSVSMDLNLKLLPAFFGEKLPRWALSGAAMFTALCVLPCAAGLALNLAQMTLTLYVKPMIAYLIVCAYLMASVLLVHPALIGNYALTVRSRALGFYPMTNTGGLLICGGVCLCAIVVGCFRMRSMDLIGQEG